MKRPRMHRYLTCGISVLAAAGLLSVLPLRHAAAQCKSVVESITSNNVRVLSGSGDTLWMLTERGVNLTSDFGEHWWGYDFSCGQDLAVDIAYGNGKGAAILQWDANKPNRLWYVESTSRKVVEGSIAYPDPDTVDSSDFRAWDLHPVGDALWVALLDGGIARWTSGKPVMAFLVGSRLPYQPGRTKPFKGSPDTTKRVFGISEFRRDSGSRLLATTTSRLWVFSPADSSWDSTITTSLDGSGYGFVSFESALLSPDSSLYAYITAKASTGKNETMLFRYSFGQSVWKLILRNSPRSIAFAPKGYFYAVQGSQSVYLYRDSAADSAIAPLTSPVLDYSHFESKMVRAAQSVPDSVLDVYFAPVNDSAGHLWIGTSDGLFLARSHVPGRTGDTLTSIRYALAVNPGLKKTYAVPGILRYDEYGRWGTTRFVYNLSKDATVTIKLFDYNMDHVKTVLADSPRKAVRDPSKRSSLQSDTWDGTDAGGRRVAPGVYYYKITTSSGERAFGKIIVAKD